MSPVSSIHDICDTHTCYSNAPLQREGLSSVWCLCSCKAALRSLYRHAGAVTAFKPSKVWVWGQDLPSQWPILKKKQKKTPPYHGLASLWHLRLCLVLGPSIVKKAAGNGPFCVRGSFSFGPCANTLGNALSLLIHQVSWPLYLDKGKCQIQRSMQIHS